MVTSTVLSELPSPRAYNAGTHVKVRGSHGDILEFVLVQSAAGERGWTGVRASATPGATGPRRMERRSAPETKAKRTYTTAQARRLLGLLPRGKS